MKTTKQIFGRYESTLIKERFGYNIYHQAYSDKLWNFIETHGIKKDYSFYFQMHNSTIECEMIGECGNKRKYIEITIYDNNIFKK